MASFPSALFCLSCHTSCWLCPLCPRGRGRRWAGPRQPAPHPRARQEQPGPDPGPQPSATLSPRPLLPWSDLTCARSPRVSRGPGMRLGCRRPPCAEQAGKGTQGIGNGAQRDGLASTPGDTSLGWRMPPPYAEAWVLACFPCQGQSGFSGDIPTPTPRPLLCHPHCITTGWASGASCSLLCPWPRACHPGPCPKPLSSGLWGSPCLPRCTLLPRGSPQTPHGWGDTWLSSGTR